MTEQDNMGQRWLNLNGAIAQGRAIRRDSVGPVIVVALIALLAAVRYFFPERPMDYVGPRAILDTGFSLWLLGVVLLLGAGLGDRVLHWLDLNKLSRLEQLVLAIPVGLGVLAYGTLALGLVGWLRPWVILLTLLGVGLWTWPIIRSWILRLPEGLALCRDKLIGLSLGEKLLLITGGLVFVLTVPKALLPPFEYDALMYHLQAPRLFLQAGRIMLLPEVWQANGPFTVEMLYVIGLAFGSDSFANLMYLACAIWLIPTAFVFGRRCLGRRESWLAAALLLGVPILPVWANLTGADMVWAMYESLAVYVLFVWQERCERRWLILAGLFMGWALGSKYLALGGASVLGLWVLWQSRRAGWKSLFTHGILFGLAALLIALPWYAKNWLWAGNPVYPFVWGGPGWDAEHLSLMMKAGQTSFGSGLHWWDYVLVPLSLYTQNEYFGTIGVGIEVPGLLIPLALLYPFVGRRSGVNSLAGMTAVRFIVWMLVSQQTRYLLPLFPALAVLSASVLDRFAGLRRLGRIAVTGLLWGMALITLLFQFMWVNLLRPVPVMVGKDSKDAFLERAIKGYAALLYVREHLSSTARVFMMWDGRDYYCDGRCLPNSDESGWTRLAATSDVSTVVVRLREKGVTHLLYTDTEARSLIARDPTGLHRRAFDFFWQEFRPFCAQEVYHSEKASLFELTCR